MRRSRGNVADLLVRYWPLIVAVVGIIGWAYRIDYMVRETRSDVDRIIRHTDWGNKGEQGPAPPVGK